MQRFTLNNAAAHDGARLSAVPDQPDTANVVWADTAYRTAANEAHPERNGFRSRIHFQRRQSADLTAARKPANRTRSLVRSAVETVFAEIFLLQTGRRFAVRS